MDLLLKNYCIFTIYSRKSFKNIVIISVYKIAKIIQLIIIKDARCSFPSTHAASSIYCAVFLTVSYKVNLICFNYLWWKLYILQYFIQHKAKSKWPIFFKAFLQILLLCSAIACSFSRIADHHHHPVDVFVGAVLGTGMALYFISIVFFFQYCCLISCSIKNIYKFLYTNLIDLFIIIFQQKLHTFKYSFQENELNAKPPVEGLLWSVL